SLTRHPQCPWTSNQRNHAKCFSARGDHSQRASGRSETDCKHADSAAHRCSANGIHPSKVQPVCAAYHRPAPSQSAKSFSTPAKKSHHKKDNVSAKLATKKYS